MNLNDQIEKELIEALKAHNDIKSSTLKLLKSSIKNKEIALKKELNGSEIIEIISKEIKQRKDSIQQYLKGHRSDLAQKEEKEIKVLEKYLPTQLSEEELTNIIKEVINDIGATSIKDLGKVMSSVMPQVKGKTDGSQVNKIALNQLNSSN